MEEKGEGLGDLLDDAAMFGHSDLLHASDVERDLLDFTEPKDQFSKSDANESVSSEYSPWPSSEKSLMEELFKVPLQDGSHEKEWSKLSDAPLLDLPTQDVAVQARLSANSATVAKLMAAALPATSSSSLKPNLAQASLSLPFPASRSQPPTSPQVSQATKSGSPKRKAAAIGGTARPRKKTKQELVNAKTSASQPSLPPNISTFSVLPSTSMTMVPSVPSPVSPVVSAPPKNGPKAQTSTTLQSTVLPSVASQPQAQPLLPISPSSTTNGGLNSSTDKLTVADKEPPLNEAAANQLLDENLHVISVMRENLVNGKVAQNFELMMRFSNNIGNVLKWLQTLSGVQMPPLPVKLNTYFFPAAATTPTGTPTTATTLPNTTMPTNSF